MAGNPIGNLVITLDFDGSKFEQGMNRAKSELTSYGRATTTALSYAKDMNYTQDASVRALNNLQVEYRGTNKMIDHYQKKMKDMRNSESYDATEYANHQKEVARYTDKLYNLSTTYDEVAKQSAYHNSNWMKSGQIFQSVGQGMMGTGQALQGIGDGLTRVGALATVGGTVFAKSAIDFEKGLTEVQKTTNATGDQMEVFERQIRDMATTMPIAHGELTELASIAGQLGVPQGEIADFTRTMAMLGTATTMSASQASESFARFTNITGSGTETIDNLGSSLVHLGNNMATTENEIMAMATQLAGTLTTVGIAEPNILALSASMSSLGITAERGASSVSKFFVDLSSAVSEGGEQLGLFADVAGMTSDQFSTLFRDDAMGAFESFIGGLSDINDSGGDAIATLESLGISEVRLRDTLLRLAQGHDVLTEGIELSNSAYIDGTRHLDEYNLMAGTTASQWQIAKNKFQDVAISVGQELLPVIIDLLDSSEGVIDMAKSVAEWFGNLDDNVKKNVVQFGALAVVLGPIISGLGSLAMAGGGALTFLGKLQDSIAWFTAMRGFTPGGITGGIATIGTVSGTTAGQVGVLTKALGLLASPAGIAVGSIVALYGAYKVLNSEAVKTSKAIMDFPDIDGITVDQANNLRESADGLDNIARSIGNINSSGDIKFIGNDVETIGQKISELNVQKIDDLREAFAILPENVQESLRDSVEATIAGLEDQVTKAEEVVQRINELSNKDTLTDGEKYEAGLLSEELVNSFALANSESHEQYLETRDYLLADIADMGQGRLRTRIANDEEYLAHVESSQQAELDALYLFHQETDMTEAEYFKQRQVIQQGYGIQRQHAVEQLLRSENEMYERLMDHSTSTQQREQYKQAQEAWLQEMADMYGVTVETIQRWINGIEIDQIPAKLVDASNQATDELNDIARTWAQTMNDFSHETGIALENITFDDVLANIDTFTKAIVESGMTWADLELLEKEGVINSDTLEFIQSILESQEMWDSIRLAEKEANIKLMGMDELEELVALFGFDFANLTDEQKTALVEAQGAKELSDLMVDYGIWVSTDPAEAKQAVVETDEALMAFQPLLADLELWNNSEFLSKYADIDTNAPGAREHIALLISEWTDIPLEEVKRMMLETNAPQTSEDLDVATGKHEIAGGVGIAEMNTSTNADDTDRKLSNVGDTLTGLNGRSARVSVNLSDNASYTIDRISEQLRSLDGRSATTYVTSLTTQAIRHAKGTAHHPGGLAILGDGGKNEPFLTPQGLLGISPSVDTLYDLPRGSKVWPNLEKFMMNFPKYANGTQQSFLDSLQVPKGFMSSGRSNIPHVPQGNNNQDVVLLLDEIARILKRTEKQETALDIDGQKFGRITTGYVNHHNSLYESRKNNLRGVKTR